MRALLRTLAGAFALVVVLRLSGVGPRPPTRHVARRLLMDTVVTVTVIPGDESGQAAAEAALDRMQDLEKVLSSYRLDGSLGRLNSTRVLAPGEVPRELDDVLRGARRSHRDTGGLYDPSLGALVNLWGFGPAGAISRPPPEEAIVRALARRGLPEGDRGTGYLLPEGVILDLGGYAKGYAVDEAVRLLAEAGHHALVDAGGDMACTGPRPDGKPWRIGVRSPDDPEGILGVIELESGAVATSGDYERFFEHDGARYHHLLDPRTGRPGRHHVQATVRSPRCAEADAWATALFLATPAQARTLAARSGFQAMLVRPGAAPEAIGGLRLTPGPGRAP